MTWIHVPPSILSTPAQAQGCSDSPSTSPSTSVYEPWLTSSGKPMRRPLSWRGWKTRPWIRLLSGMTSTPQETESSLKLWRASALSSCAPGIHASHSASPDDGLVRTILGIYGLPFLVYLRRSNPNASFSRMCQVTLGWDSTRSEEIYRDKATALRQDCFERMRSARATSGSDSSSSDYDWRTPAVQEPGVAAKRLVGKQGHRMYDRENGRQAQYGLIQQIEKWPTSNAHDQHGARGNGFELTDHHYRPHDLHSKTKSWDTPKGCSDKYGPNQRDSKGRMQLQAQASNWPTPTKSDGNSQVNPSPKRCGGIMHESLRVVANNWPSPDCRNMMDGKSMRKEAYASHGVSLHHRVSSWPTPRSSTNENRTTKNAPSHGAGHGKTLAGEVGNWPTVSARDWRSGKASDATMTRNARPLNEMVISSWKTPHGFQAGNGPMGNEFSQSIKRWKTPTRSLADKETAGKCGTRKRIPAQCQSLLRGQETQDGQPSSKKHPGSRLRLNPVFVEWLMGWPMFHTCTNCKRMK